jgi:hypothetical protein
LLLSVLAISIHAQTSKNCVTPISNFAFQQLMTTMNSKSDEAQKLVFSKKIARENCLSTEQVKQIAEIFGNDYNRLAFVQIAYESTTDKDNFYEVYNSFTYFSNVFRLHDYVNERRTGTKPNQDVTQNLVMTFPAYEYPDYRKYFGKIGCSSILADQDFLSLADKVFREPTDDKKLAIANNITFGNCLQTAQAMKIASLFQNETYRLEFLKKAYTKIFDPDNYKHAFQVFSSENSKKDFNTFLGGGVTEITTINPPCEVSLQDFTSIKNQITKQSFVNTKMNIARQNIKDKKCFKTAQIIEIMALFTFKNGNCKICL